MPAPFNAPLADWHDCNYYCRGAEHCDINYQWYSGGELPFDEAMARRFYARYGGELLRVEPAREIRPTEGDVPGGHVLGDFRGAYLVWFHKKDPDA